MLPTSQWYDACIGPVTTLHVVPVAVQCLCTNALTYTSPQVEAMLATSQEWDERPDVCCVLINSNAPKASLCVNHLGDKSHRRLQLSHPLCSCMQAFCAGGDIKACATAVRDGDTEGPLKCAPALSC